MATFVYLLMSFLLKLSTVSDEITPVPGNRTFRSQDVSFPGTKRLYMDDSFFGRFVPWTFRSQDDSYPGRFVLWTFRSLDVSFSRRFVPWTIRSLDVSFYGRFVLSLLI